MCCICTPTAIWRKITKKQIISHLKSVNQVADNHPTGSWWVTRVMYYLCIGPQIQWKGMTLLDLERLNQALNRSVHSGLMINAVLPILAKVMYLALTYVSSSYHNLKIMKNHIWCLHVNFSNTYMQNSNFEFHQLMICSQKIDRTFRELQNALEIADVFALTMSGHYEEYCWIREKKIWKKNASLFSEIISRHGVRPDLCKL